MEKRYEIVDTQGRRWALKLTAKGAVKLADSLTKEKGILFYARPVQGGN